MLLLPTAKSMSTGVVRGVRAITSVGQYTALPLQAPMPTVPSIQVLAVSRAAPSIATRATRWIRRWSMMRMAEEKNNNLKEHGYEGSN